MSLYTISEDILSLMNTFDTEEEWDEIDMSALADKMSSLQWDFNEKVAACILYMRERKSLSEWAKAEKDRLAKLEKQYANQEESTKRFIDFCLKRLWVTALDLPVAKISYRSYPSVFITDESIIPDDYLFEKISVSIDKDKIKDAIKNGTIVPWAEIDPNVKIQIK